MLFKDFHAPYEPCYRYVRVFGIFLYTGPVYIYVFYRQESDGDGSAVEKNERKTKAEVIE